MIRYTHSFLVAVGLALLMTHPGQTSQATPILSQSVAAGSEDGKSAEELARDAVEKLMQALELMFREIPQYSLPEINENGDIIIRRIHPEPPTEEAPEEEKQPEPESTDT